LIKYFSALFLILYFSINSSATSIELQDPNGDINPILDKENDILEMTIIADFGNYHANGIELYITFNSELLEIQNLDSPFEIEQDSKFSSGISVINKVFGNNNKNQAGFASIILTSDNIQSFPTASNNKIAKVKFNINKSYLNNIEIIGNVENIKIGDKKEEKNLDNYVKGGFASKVDWKVINEKELRQAGIILDNHFQIDNSTLVINPSETWKQDEIIQIQTQAFLNNDETKIYFNHTQRDRDKNRYTFFTSLGDKNPEHYFDEYLDSNINIELGKKIFVVSAITYPPEINKAEFDKDINKNFEKGKTVTIDDLNKYVSDRDTDLNDIKWIIESADKNKINVEINQKTLIIKANQITEQPIEIRLMAEDPDGNKDEFITKITVVLPALKIEDIPEQQIERGEMVKIELNDYVENREDIQWTAESGDENKVNVKITQNILEIEARNVTEQPVEIIVVAKDSDGNTDETSIKVTVISTPKLFIGKIIDNPIIPMYLHIVAIAKEEIHVPFIYAKLNVKDEPIELERRGKIWVGIYKRNSLDEEVKIESIKTKK